MAWQGDISRLARLAETVRNLRQIPSQAATKAAFALEDLVLQEFEAGQDPYGTAWEPLAESTRKKGRHPPPLTDTHEMGDSSRFVPVHPAGVEITIAHPAPAHQTGWSGPQGSGPARPIFPERGLPETWKQAITDAVEAAVDEAKRFT